MRSLKKPNSARAQSVWERQAEEVQTPFGGEEMSELRSDRPIRPRSGFEAIFRWMEQPPSAGWTDEETLDSKIEQEIDSTADGNSGESEFEENVFAAEPSEVAWTSRATQDKEVVDNYAGLVTDSWNGDATIGEESRKIPLQGC